MSSLKFSIGLMPSALALFCCSPESSPCRSSLMFAGKLEVFFLIRDVCFFFFALIGQGLRWPVDRPGPPSVLTVDVTIGTHVCFLRPGKSLCLVGVSSSLIRSRRPERLAGVPSSYSSQQVTWVNT